MALFYTEETEAGRALDLEYVRNVLNTGRIDDVPENVDLHRITDPCGVFVTA